MASKINQKNDAPKMKGHQGDVQFMATASLPKNAKKMDKTWFAMSERSGNCHALTGSYEMYETEEGETYVKVFGEGAILNHTDVNLLSTPAFFDKKQVLEVRDHKPVFFEPGIYKIGIQRRVDPFEGVWKRVKD